MNEQHEFHPGECSITCNLTFTNYVNESFKYYCQFYVIYTDFAKVFDSINHNVLINILKYSDIDGFLLSWFKTLKYFFI